MRKFIIALAVLLAIIFLISKFAEVQDMVATFQRGDWRFLILALFVQAAWLFTVGASYRAIFAIQGIPAGFSHMVRLSSAANFFNIVAPSGGMGSLLVFFADARKNGYSPARAAVSGALYVLFDYAGLLCILPFGFSVLFQNNRLHFAEVGAAIILILLGGGLAFLLYLGMRSEAELGRALTFLTRLVNRILNPFIHREYLSEILARSFARDAAEGIREVRLHPGALGRPLLLALANKSLMILVLLLVFLAFKVPFSFGIIIAGFSMAYLFLIVSPTPSGIGIVEGVLTLALRSLGIALEDAVVISLAYRGFTFWVPFFVGMGTFRNLIYRREISRAEV